MTADADIRKLLRREEKKSCRVARSAKFASVCEKTYLTGTASRSLYVFKAAMIIQMIGRKKMIATIHRMR